MKNRVRFIRKKNNYFLLIVIILFAFILNNKIVNAATLTLTECSKNDAEVLSTSEINSITNSYCLIKFNGNINNTNKIATKINSINLQRALDYVSENGGGTVQMPSGRFYFSYLGKPYHYDGTGDRTSIDNYVENQEQWYAIRVRNNVTLTGSIYVGGYPATILATYHLDDEIFNKHDHGIDMFYYNNIRDTGYASKIYGTEFPVKWMGYKLDNVTDDTLYWFGRTESISMNNVTFKNFIIDGEVNAAYSYESSGNGFRTSFYEDCVWDNVIVMNTNATGFGCDYPKNSIIKNSKAINCGKEAKKYYIDTDGTVWDGGIERAPGGSGFGIGTGYSDEESLIITECEAFNNAKFGFFFEQQSRFGSNNFNSIKGKFVVKNSIAGGNMFDYGGLYGTGAIYDNVKSVSGNKSYTSSTGITSNNKKTINLEANNQSEKHESHPLRFGMFSANNYIINSDLSSALADNGTENEAGNSIKWAVNSGVLDVDINTQEEYDAGNYGTYFKPTSYVTRFDAIVALYKFNNMPMELQPESSYNHYNRKKSDGVTVNEKSLQTYFDKINVADAANLYGNKKLNDTQLSLTKYKKAGDLDALKWAYETGIAINSQSGTDFNFDDNCTRAMIVSYLYRMAGSPKVNNTISFSDVEPSVYYYDAVRWAVDKGITSGTSNTEFSPSGIVNKRTLAVFLKRYYDNISYIVGFETNGGESINNQNVKHGDLISQVNPTKTGYTFNGWYSDSSLTIKNDFTINGKSEQYSFSTPVTSNKKLYAKWTANTYTIKYTMNGAAAKADETGTFDAAKNIANPSKTFTVNINANSQSATIKNSGGTDVTSASAAQTFAGWTSNSSAGLGSNAKMGTSASGATTAWAGAATKNTYFKNLRDTSGNVTLTATWTAVAVKLPKITKTGYTCGYAESASGTIKYASEANYTPSTTTGSVTLYAKCNTNTYTIKYTMNGAAAKADETGTFDAAKNIANPSKTFTVNINANSQSATIKNSGGTDVTSASAAQTFAGWTSNSSAGLGSNAKMGTSASGATTAWAGAATKNTYFKNLRDTSGNVTLTATWTAVAVKLPKITKTGYTCGYAESASGTIKYASEANYTPSTTTGSVTLYAKCNTNTHVNNTVDYEGIYDGKDHTISINVGLDNFVIKYSVGNTNYDLTELPKFKDVGEYTINYKISSNGYDDLIGSNKVKIYGIKKIDSSIKIKDNKLIIQDNSFNSISNKITVYSISNEFKHYNKNNELVSNDTLKTGDVIKIVLNGTSSQEYRVVFLGDTSGDGKINYLDYVNVYNHIQKVKHPESNKILLKDEYLLAADMSGDNKISYLDYVRIYNKIKELKGGTN